MRDRVLHHAPLLYHIRTQLNTICRIKAALHPLKRLTAPTADIRLVQLSAQFLDVARQVVDDGRVFQEIVALFLAAIAVGAFEADVGVGPVVHLALGRHAADDHTVEVEEAIGEGAGGEELFGAAAESVGDTSGRGRGRGRGGRGLSLGEGGGGSWRGF